MKWVAIIAALVALVGCDTGQSRPPVHMTQAPDPAAPTERIELTLVGSDDAETDKLARACPGSNCVTTWVDMDYGFGWGRFGDNTFYGTYPTSIGTNTSAPLTSVVATLNLPRFAVSKAPISYRIDLDPSGTTMGVANSEWETALAATIQVLEDETDGEFVETTGNANIRWRFDHPYTPSYERERFYKVGVGNVNYYGSSIGPVQAYYRCYIDFGDDMEDYMDQVQWGPKFLAQKMLLRTAYTCLGRGTDYFPQNPEIHDHHIPGPWTPNLYGGNGRMNADYDQEPFFDGDWPAASGNVPGFTGNHWALHEHWIRNYYPHNL